MIKRKKTFDWLQWGFESLSIDGELHRWKFVQDRDREVHVVYEGINKTDSKQFERSKT